MTDYAIHVKVEDRYSGKVKPALLRAAARAALAHQAVPASAELTIVVSGDAFLRRLNRQYLGHDTPTDVLSFPVDGADAVGGPRELGDVVICPDHAEDLAEVVVHGVLHLCGFDHETDDGEMLALQRRVLEDL